MSDDVAVHCSLSREPLNVAVIMDKVRSPKAGAIVVFAGTTRDNFGGKPVKELEYTSYEEKAVQTMIDIAMEVESKHSLNGIAIVHRLGAVPIGEESIVIAVSSPHRQAAWKAGEEALELCKEKVEVWKKEEFGGQDGGVWRANKDAMAEYATDSRAEPTGDGRNTAVGGLSQLSDNVGRPKAALEKGHGPVAHQS